MGSNPVEALNFFQDAKGRELCAGLTTLPRKESYATRQETSNSVLVGKPAEDSIHLKSIT